MANQIDVSRTLWRWRRSPGPPKLRSSCGAFGRPPRQYRLLHADHPHAAERLRQIPGDAPLSALLAVEEVHGLQVSVDPVGRQSTADRSAELGVGEQELALP